MVWGFDVLKVLFCVFFWWFFLLVAAVVIFVGFVSACVWIDGCGCCLFV